MRGRWEYKVLAVQVGTLDEHVLNAHGAERWELVAVRGGASTVELVFKRPVLGR